MKKVTKASRDLGKLKVKTSLSLSKTRPLKERKIQRLQSSLKAAAPKPEPQKAPSQPVSPKDRQKPVSQIDADHRTNLWLIPARIAFFLNGLYFLGFSIISFLGLFSGYKIIKPFFTLPFDTSFSSFFLLEIAAFFSFMVSLMFLHAARYPRLYRWFYLLLIILILPYHFVSNYQKLQIELPVDFQNYLYFDTVVMMIIWLAFLGSLYSYLKLSKVKK